MQSSFDPLAFNDLVVHLEGTFTMHFRRLESAVIVRPVSPCVDALSGLTQLPVTSVSAAIRPCLSAISRSYIVLPLSLILHQVVMLEHLAETMSSPMFKMTLISVTIVQYKLAFTMLASFLSATLIQGIIGILHLSIDFLDGIPRLQAIFIITGICVRTSISELFDLGKEECFLCGITSRQPLLFCHHQPIVHSCLRLTRAHWILDVCGLSPR